MVKPVKSSEIPSFFHGQLVKVPHFPTAAPVAPRTALGKGSLWTPLARRGPTLAAAGAATWEKPVFMGWGQWHRSHLWENHLNHRKTVIFIE